MRADEGADILLVEDDDSLREVMTFNLEEAGHRVEPLASGQAALERYDPASHDLVVTDLRMPGLDGMGLLEALRERDPEAVVLMVTAYGSAGRAVEAMRRGAFHYVEKPVNTRALLAIVDKALEHRDLLQERNRLARQRDAGPTLVAASPAMNELLRLVDRVAPSAATILITGESGTGKELIARAIHDRSPRRSARFVAVNCAAIPAELLESTLFGHARGAFTGAERDRPGKFQLADGGTLFLDEIAEMSPQLQSKLLRVLQEGEVDVVGGGAPQSVDVRVLAATHQALSERVKDGDFRADLYYRLNVVPLHIPPLRERPEDIPVLARFFLRQLADGPMRLEQSVDEALLEYDWPGNVRELRNHIERMILLAEGDMLGLEDLPDELRPSPPGAPASAPSPLPFELPEQGLDLMALEREIIRAALRRHDGNQSATARYLSIPRHVLLYRIEKYELGEDELDDPS